MAEQNCGGGASLVSKARVKQRAGAPHGSVDAAQHQHLLLGPVSRTCICDAIQDRRAKLDAGKESCADPKYTDETPALNIFWAPPETRRAHLKARAKQPTLGRIVAEAMPGIDRDDSAPRSVSANECARATRWRVRPCRPTDLNSRLPTIGGRIARGDGQRTIGQLSHGPGLIRSDFPFTPSRWRGARHADDHGRQFRALRAGKANFARAQQVVRRGAHTENLAGPATCGFGVA